MKNKEKKMIVRNLSDVQKIYMQKHRNKMDYVLSIANNEG